MRAGPPLVLFVFVFAVYAFCAYPTIAPRDSADLARAAVTLGIAHPPGYPLYAVLGHAWFAAFPWGNPAYRLSLMSAAFGALAVTCVFSLLRRQAGLWAGLAAAAVLAFSVPLWKFSLLQEMYSLHVLIAAILLGLAEGDVSTLDPRWQASALLFGLGLVNHQTLILLAPALGFLWRREFARHEREPDVKALALFALGLALYAAVWIRLGDVRQAWAVVTRREYGTLSLSEQFARPITLAGVFRQLGHLVVGLGNAVSWVAVLLAGAGFLELRKRRRELAMGLGLALLCFGPIYFLITRFDVSGWVARSVLEPSFLVPALILAWLSAAGMRGIQDRQGEKTAMAVSLTVAAGVLWLHGPRASHRDDFSAYDYAKDLRRLIPPGGAAIVAGDTALFSWSYLDAIKPPAEGFPARLLMGSLEENKREFIESHVTSPVYVVGLGLGLLKELGLWGNPYSLSLDGVAQRVIQEPVPGVLESAWELSVFRPSRARASGESYARDVVFSYAYAHYLTAQLYEKYGAPEWVLTAYHLYAHLLDPETYPGDWIPLKTP